MNQVLRRKVVLSIVAACFLLYGNSLFNNYSIDDGYVIVGHPRVEKGISGIPEIFTSQYAIDKKQKYGYRPVTLSSFALEYQFFGAVPFVSHLINLLIYTLTCLILFKLLKRLFQNYHWSLSAIAVGIFIVHPIHSEVVNNVKSRDELLCFLFALLSLFNFIKYADTKKYFYIGSGLLLLVLSLLSKPSSITYFAIIPFTLYYFTDIKWKGIGSVALAFVGFVLLVRIAVPLVIDLDGEVISRNAMFFENPLYHEKGTFISRIPTAFYTVLLYTKLLVVPHPLVFYYGFDYVPIAGWNDIQSWIAILSLVSGTGYALYKMRSKTIVSFGILYFLITISMFSNLIKPAPGIIAERFVYLPSLGFCIVAAYGLFHLINKKDYSFEKNKVIFSTLIVMFTIAFVRVVVRNQDWNDQLTLVGKDIQYLEKSVKANTMYADLLFIEYNSTSDREKKLVIAEKAIKHYNQAIRTYPDHKDAINNLGVLYLNIGLYQAAIQNMKKAIELGATDSENYFNLGAVYEMNGNKPEAIQCYQRALTVDAEYLKAKSRLDVLLEKN